MAAADPRFTSARFGPWASGPLNHTDPEPINPEPVIPDQPEWGDGAIAAGPPDTAGPGGFRAPGMAFFDDGGVVPGESDPQGDPLSVIRKAMQLGRQQSGLPATFYGGEGADNAQQGFDDGGEVEEEPMGGDQQGVIPDEAQSQQQPQEQQQGGGSSVRKGLQYLTGQGAVRPEVAKALEQHAGGGEKDPAARKFKAAMAAPDDASRFAYMQSLRQQFNAHVGAAQAALKIGKIGMAAHHATEAFSNVPSGQSVRFAPAPGGLVMMAKPIGGGSQVQGAASGGVIDSDETNPSLLQDMKGYDDGGEVEGDDYNDVTGAVTPQPLTPQQAAQVVQHGAFDQIVDQGWDKYSSNFAPAGGSGMGRGAPTQPDPRGMVKPSEALPPDMAAGLGERGQGGAPEGGHEPAGLPGSEQDYAEEAVQRPQVPEEPAQAQQAAPQQVAQAQIPEDKYQVRSDYTPSRQARGMSKETDPEEEMLQRRVKMLERIAAQRFPQIGGDMHARREFVEKMLHQLYGDDKTVHQAQAKGEAAMKALELKGGQGKEHDERVSARGREHDTNVAARHERSLSGKMSIAEMQQAARLQGTGLQEAGKNFRTMMANKPGMGPEEIQEQLRPIARKLKMDTQSAMDVLHYMAFPDQYSQNVAKSAQGASQPQEPPSKGYAPVIVQGGKRYRHVGDGQYQEVK